MDTGLDIENSAQLIAYLVETGWIDTAESASTTVLHGGVSNKTVLVERANGDDWVLKQALPKLRVQVDWFSPVERVHREALGLRWLERIAPPGTTTPLVFEDFDHHLIAMAAVPQPHENWKQQLLRGEVEPDHVEQFATLLGTIHREGARRRGELEPVFGDRGFFESLRLEPYFGFTASEVPEARRFLLDLIDETRAHIETLVHGDYSPKNILVHDDRLILLDHEVIHFGDPTFDLGFSMTHFLSKAHHLPERREQFVIANNAYWTRYRSMVADEPWADDLDARAVRKTLGVMLARVRGRSPLEYLDETERSRQADAIVTLMADPPGSIPELASAFIQHISGLE
ncbi:MAG: phosphotransferase [Thermomicrobiales bacterium]|nr:phosphotransferase [Thermomicrobiales bacterium]